MINKARRQELMSHCENELSALRLSLTLSCLTDNEVKDIKVAIETHEVALSAMAQLSCESVTAGLLCDVRDSLELSPHQNAVITAAIKRLNAYSKLLNKKPKD